MSTRLAKAIVEYIDRMPGESKFILMEAIPEDLAEGIASAWRPTLPQLLIGGGRPERFGDRALGGRSGTQIRNLYGQGVCVIACEGFDFPDWQSVSKFESVSPSNLLQDPAGLIMLADADRPVDPDGPIAYVRLAIVNATAQERPTPFQAAAYFDAVAAGEDAGLALPRLGAFRDPQLGAARSRERAAENLRLARAAFDGAGKYNEIRRRAGRVLARDGARPRGADDVMRLLGTSDPGLYEYLDFDEARSILEDHTPDLPESVRLALGDFRRAYNGDVPWQEYENAADNLKRGDQRREAAEALIAFDDSCGRRVFDPPLRKKLENLRKDKTLSSSPQHDNLEEMFVQGIANLSSRLVRIEVLGAPLPEKVGSRAEAQRVLVAAAAAMRVGVLMERIATVHGVDVAGALTASPRSILETDDGSLFEEALRYAGIDDDTNMPQLAIKVIGAGRDDAVELRWRPGLDDIAVLRAAAAFAERPVLTLRTPCVPFLGSFCGALTIGLADPAYRHRPLAERLHQTAGDILDRGLSPVRLRAWTESWKEAVEQARADQDDGREALEGLSLSGAVIGPRDSVALSALAPLKAEWLAQQLELLGGLVEDVAAARAAGDAAGAGGIDVDACLDSARALARAAAAHYPAFLRSYDSDSALLPISESSLWSVYGIQFERGDDLNSEAAVGAVFERLLRLQPEVGRHVKCITFGPNAATIMVRQVLRLLDKRIGHARFEQCEIYCVDERPDPETLYLADERLNGQRRRALQLRYFRTFDDARAALGGSTDGPGAHLALITGLSGSAALLTINPVEIPMPERDNDVVLTPRTWMRPGSERRMLLAPPGVTEAGASWLRLMEAVGEDAWSSATGAVQVPELVSKSNSLRVYLRAAHECAMWVATVDRYVSRDILERAMGEDVAILHQERRLGGDSPVGLVISQKTGGSTDRAIARSLRAARIVEDIDDSLNIGRKLRKVASQGYGVLALEAATTGSGINELVAHVIAFALLGTKGTPWPLPPHCRVLLLSLDEYADWFPRGKRADLLALAIDTVNQGVHVAAMEVKARRSDDTEAVKEAIDQLRQTINTTRFAAYHDPSCIHTRIWLNRVAEVAYGVAREINFRLSQDEIGVLEQFRRGRGTLEWGGMGLIFGPGLEPYEKDYQQPRFGDLVPIAVHTVPLTQDLLEQAMDSHLSDLRTVDTGRSPIPGGRERRRPERGVERPERDDDKPAAFNGDGGIGAANEGAEATGGTEGEVKAEANQQPAVDIEPVEARPTAEQDTPSAGSAPANIEERAAFNPPILGWLAGTAQELRWFGAGADDPRRLSNGHIEVWGTSGAGKTQFTKALLVQLTHSSSVKFGISDFKNDYGQGDDFLQLTRARFFDIWKDGVPYNPLALLSSDDSAIRTAAIELRDIVDEAAKSYTPLGRRQLDKLREALEKTFEVRRTEGRWPTLRTLDDYLDADLKGSGIGDLTRNPLFKDGDPLGDVIYENAVFGLASIPGNGLTTILAGGFILSALLLKIQGLTPVANTIRYMAVVDEAHRVAKFKPIDTMVREGRSKGLAVLLATQQPSDLPDVIATNAQTKICFRLPDATMARAAAKRLNPGDKQLPDLIRSLNTGEALVSLGGEQPQLVRMAQLYRDQDKILG